MKLAVIENNVVINIIVADSVEIAETITNGLCVEYTDNNPASIGWTYADGVFTAPVVEETPAE